MLNFNRIKYILETNKGSDNRYMSEIKQNRNNLEIVKNGENRSPDTSYTEYLSQDSKKVPDFMVEESYDFLGSEDIDASRYFSREFFEKEKIS